MLLLSFFFEIKQENILLKNIKIATKKHTVDLIHH